MKKLELSGGKFGRLLVLSLSIIGKNGKTKWLCKCECGEEIVVEGSKLKNGHTQSCGCLWKERFRNIPHGHDASRLRAKFNREYRIYRGMKTRCSNPNIECYKDYGGRGITVCDRWLESFENFFEDMGPCPTPQHSIDRWPNNETGLYEPGNCRWGTDEQQRRNKRNNIWIEYNGESKIKEDWLTVFGIKNVHLKHRLDRGESYKEIFDKLSKGEKIRDLRSLDPVIVLEIFNHIGTFKEIATVYNVSENTVWGIKSGNKWSIITGKEFIRERTTLTHEQIIEIYTSTKNSKILAEEYKLSHDHVKRIRSGKCHKELTKNHIRGIYQRKKLDLT